MGVTELVSELETLPVVVGVCVAVLEGLVVCVADGVLLGVGDRVLLGVGVIVLRGVEGGVERDVGDGLTGIDVEGVIVPESDCNKLIVGDGLTVASDTVPDFDGVNDEVPEGVCDKVRDFDGEGVDDRVPDLLGVAVVLLEQVVISEVAPLKEQAEGQLHGVHDDEPLYE